MSGRAEHTYLGMTKPLFALAVSVVATVGFLMTSAGFLWALQQNHVTVSHLTDVTHAQQRVLARTRNSLAEVCRTNSVSGDAIGTTVRLLKRQIRSGGLPPSVVAIDRKALDEYEGYQLRLANRTACPEVKP